MATDTPDPATRARLPDLVLAGENLYGQAGGAQPQAALALRQKYLAWHSDLLQLLNTRFDDELVAKGYETRRWELVLGGQVADDQLIRTILGDLDAVLPRLRALLEDPSAAPARVLPDPRSVGVAVYDANVLFPKHLRYLLLGLGAHGVVRARWSRQLLKEAAGNLAGHLRGDSLEDLGRWIRDDTGVVRVGLVEGYERWCEDIQLPDDGDVHVVAAAIECGATQIVTSNLKDFPDEVLKPYGITAVDPDTFALTCIDANPVLADRIVADHPDPSRLLDRLEGELPRSVAALRELRS